MKKLKYSSLDEILRASLTKKNLKRQKTTDNDWIWASELGQCKRHQFLRRMGVPFKPLPWRITFTGEIGSAMHDRVENMVKEIGALVVAEERYVIPSLHYKGRSDLIVNLNTKKDPYLSLIDIKTQRPEAFMWRKRASLDNKIKKFQKMQLCSYTHFAKEKYPDIKDSRLYFIDRAGGVREEFIFHFTDKDYAEMLAEIDTLNGYWDRQEVPPCDEGWLCANSCRPYKKILKKVEDGELTIKEFKQKYVSKK